MKKCFILILLFALGCKENNFDTSSQPTAGWTKSVNNHFDLEQFVKAIKVADLTGEWRLTNSWFEYSRGMINNLAGYFYFPVEKQVMTIDATNIKKLIFLNPPAFVDGTHNIFSDSTVTCFTWTPASGHQAKNVYINYTNNILNLYYDGDIVIHNKTYHGSIFETYVKK